jgi:hypothetical protein
MYGEHQTPVTVDRQCRAVQSSRLVDRSACRLGLSQNAYFARLVERDLGSDSGPASELANAKKPAVCKTSTRSLAADAVGLSRMSDWSFVTGEDEKSLLAVLRVEQFVVGHNHVSLRIGSGAILRIARDMT